jgi:hypothetical protein
MKPKRKPIFQTNLVNVVVLAIIFAPLFGAITENLKVFIGSVLTIPVLVILLLCIWLRFGHSGILVNSINVFIMIAMMAFYCSVPLFYLVWGSWLIWLLLGIYLVTFLVGYINKEKLIMKLSVTEGSDGVPRPAKFLLCYSLGAFVIGVIGVIIVNTAIYTGGQKIYVFGFFYLLSYYLFAVSPAFLVKPTRALEMGAITEDHYNQYH